MSRAAATDKRRKGNEGKSDSFDGWTLLERRMLSSHTQRSSYLLPVSACMESDVHVHVPYMGLKGGMWSDLLTSFSAIRPPRRKRS